MKDWMSVWQRNAKAIKKSNAKTIKELVDLLRASGRKKPLIKEINKDDAVSLLIDIGLNALPFGTKYRKQVQQKLKNSPEKINIENFLAALEKISVQKNLDPKNSASLKRAVKIAKSSNIKSPFDDKTPLPEHPLTAPLFRKTVIDDVVLALGFGERIAAILSKQYKSPDEFQNSNDEDIKKIVRISSERIQKIKGALSWTKYDDISIPLAVAFASVSLDLQDIIEMSVNDLQKEIKKSKVSVPSEDKTQSNLKKINIAVRKKLPKSAYYNDAISSLQLPQKARKFLESRKIKSFRDLRKKGLLEEVIEKGDLTDKKVLKLKAYLDLSSISSEFEVNTKIIAKGYSHPYQITQVTRDLFIKNLSQEIGDYQSALIYEKAVVQSQFLNNIGTGAMADAANGYKEGIHKLLGDSAVSPPCHCRDCESAVSPLAYLVDLLDYAVKHLRKSNDTTISLSDLTEQFGQLFGELPAICKTVSIEVRQARIGIEVLRKQTIPSDQISTLQEAESVYLLNTYQGILGKMGTSLQELRLSKSSEKDERERLAAKLGIELTNKDELNRLLLSNEAGTPDKQQLTERNVEILFGLVDTTRHELSNGAKLNDPDNKLLRWNFDGVEWNKNTDENGRVYLTVEKLGLSRYWVRIYRDASRSDLVANGQAFAFGLRPVKITLSGSGNGLLSGHLEIIPTAPTYTIEFSLIPEFLCRKLKYLRKIWRDADWTEDAYSKALLPIIDPDLIGPDDIRTPLHQNPTYQIWETRRKWVDSQIKDTFGQITKGGGSPVRITRSQNMLREMRQNFTYKSASYHAWPNTYDLVTLVEIHHNIKSGNDLELMEKRLQRLMLSADELSRLIEIKDKDGAIFRDNSLEPVTKEEWDDFISILVQIRKRTLYGAWINEEEPVLIHLDNNFFVIAANPPEQGDWPLKIDVIIDPDLLARENIRQSINKYLKILKIYDDRKTVLDTIYQRKQNEKENHGYPWLLEDSIKKVDSNVTIDALKILNAQLADSDTTISTVARNHIENLLKLKVEGEFDYLIRILLEEEIGETIKEGDWDKIYSILTKHEKVCVLYGRWKSDEKIGDINYWDVFPMHLAAWRSSNTARFSWQEALRIRSAKPMIDPDIIESDHIRGSLNGRAAELWNERRLWVNVWKAEFEDEVDISVDLLTTFDNYMGRMVYTIAELVFLRRWVKHENSRYGLDAVLEGIFNLAVPELIQLHADLSASGTISEEAKHKIINNLYISIPDYEFVIDIRKRNDSGASISPSEWKSLYKILARVLQIREVLKLDAQRNSGHNINPYLTQMNLSYPAFSYLVKMRKLISEGPNILKSEWANIFSILIQVEKTLTFPKWGREERGGVANTDPILLGPDDFSLDKESGSTPWVWEGDPSSRWRAARRDLREWQEKLQGRIKQQESIITEFRGAVDSVEEMVLPELRSALISAVSGASNDENPARILGDRFAISMEVGGCQKTTRVSQAIKTVQTLLWSMRTGLMNEPTLTLDAVNFDEEWKWIGSFSSWRAAMVAFLYPENLIIPTLRIKKTPTWKILVDEIQIKRFITTSEVLETTKTYNKYITEIFQLAESIDATCEAETRIIQNKTHSRFSSNRETLFFMFANDRHKHTRNVYWSAYDKAGFLNGHNDRQTQTFWKKMEVFKEYKISSIVGAVPYTIKYGGEEGAHKRYMYLFVLIEDFGGKQLMFTRYDLDNNGLSEKTFEMVGGWSDPVILEEKFGRHSSFSPCINPIDKNLPPKVVYFYNRELKMVELDITGTAWGTPQSIPGTNYSFDFQRLTSITSITSAGKYISYLVFYMDSAPASSGGESYDIYKMTNSPSVNTYTTSAQKILTFSNQFIGAINNYIFNKTFGSQRIQQATIKDDGSTSWDTFSQNNSKIDKIATSAYSELYVTNDSNIASISHLYPISKNDDDRIPVTPERHRVDVEINPGPKSSEYVEHIQSWIEKTNDKPGLIYINEGYYFLPIYIALKYQYRGEYQAALDWFRSVYDYQAPLDKRKNYPGLELEETIQGGFQRPVNWLDDPINPHTYASNRAFCYTRFTIMAIVRCLQDYGDAEFGRDTVKSVARAEELYKEALELLSLDVLKQHSDDCDQIIGTIDFSVAGPELGPAIMQIKEALSQINDPTLLEATVNSVKQELTGGAGNSWRERLRKVNTLVKDAIQKQSVAKTLDEVLTEQPAEIARVYDKLLQNPVVFSGSERVQSISEDRFTSGVVQATGLEEKELLKKKTKLSWLRGSATTNSETNTALQPVSSSNVSAQLSLGISYAYSTPGNVSNPTWTFCIPPNPILTSLRLHAELNLQKIWTCRNIAGMKRELEPYEAPTDTTTGVTFLGMSDALTGSMGYQLNPTPYRFKVLIARAKELVQLAQQMESAFISALEKRDNTAYTLFKARQDEEIARSTVQLQNLRVKESEDGLQLAKLQLDKAQLLSDSYQQWIEEDLLREEVDLLNAYEGLMELQMIHLAGVETLEAGQIAIQIATIPNVWVGLAAAATAATALSAKIYSEIEIHKKQEFISKQSLLASHARRKQEWVLQKSLADQDIIIGGQQITITEDQVRIVNQEKRIAEMQADHASDTIEFLGNQLFNDEMYEWMSRILEGTYRFFLQQATSVARLAENQLVFERKEIPAKIVQADYWEVQPENAVSGADSDNNTDRRGITGSARLLQDIYQLDQFAFEAQKRKDILTKTFSLSAQAPAEFARFRETGVLQFATPMRLFDQGLPGHYHRLIRRVRIGVLALIPPIQGIRAILTTTGISRIVVGDTIFQTREIRRMPESITLTSPSYSTELVELQAEQAAEMLLPFEGMGVDTNWEFRLPKAGNQFDFSTITDILFSMDYTSLYSPIYYQQVVSQLDQRFLADHVLSIKHQLPDVWYHLHNRNDNAPIQMEFEVTRSSFPPNLDNIHIRELLLYISGEVKEVIDKTKVTLSFTVNDTASAIHGDATPINQTINTLKGNGGGWESFKNGNRNPFGKWTFEFEDTPEVRNLLKDNKLNDILFVISYSGDTPPWPVM